MKLSTLLLAVSQLGSKIGKQKGNKFIKNIFIIIGALLGTKLLLGF